MIIGNGTDPLHEILIEYTQHIIIDIILLHSPTLMKHMMLIGLATRLLSAKKLISLCSQTRMWLSLAELQPVRDTVYFVQHYFCFLSTPEKMKRNYSYTVYVPACAHI